MKMPRILLTGGGTAGHVTPNLSLVPLLREKGFDITYAGTKEGIERKLVEEKGIKYLTVSAGKLRRYLDLKNITDIGRITKGFAQALNIMRKVKPDVIFSKGGFVSAPVVWAAYLCAVPVVIHESDISPGLANKLCLPFASKICYSFPETARHFKKKKAVFTGLPVRDELLKGSAERGLEMCGFKKGRPVLMVIGGSQGSKFLNDLVRESLRKLTREFQVCHICGKGGVDEKLENTFSYKQFEYLDKELADAYAMADLVVSRAGATVLFELLTLKKPNLLIPLSKKASRGDQILNARSFEKQGYSCALSEEETTPTLFLSSLRKIYRHKSEYIEKMEQGGNQNSVEKVVKVISSATPKRPKHL
ncbi:MAG: undecaprenyldiphospho-muramoylpentapeptide beta-N-acetylglucosaminyltransferase [Eubacteriales bacterium]|nr:undecaprenyldiphospho-muramoylpentapeptide beta-N-acetylglucosaminyltransferase [Eubacteriales bacterium]